MNKTAVQQRDTDMIDVIAQPDRIIWSPLKPEDLERLQRVQQQAVTFGTGAFVIMQKGETYEFAQIQAPDLWKTAPTPADRQGFEPFEYCERN